MRRSPPMRALAVLLCAVITALAPSCATGPSNLGRLRHVVLFKFKDGTPPDRVAAIEAAFRQLRRRIPEIVDFEWGTDNSPEGLADGFTHCFLVTFADADGRAVYLPHPAHQEFVTLLKPSLDKVLVIDYVARD